MNADNVSPGDYILSDTGRLGARTFVSRAEYGGRGKEFSTNDEAIAWILDNMKAENFWPNVWYLSDHGNLTLQNGVGLP